MICVFWKDSADLKAMRNYSGFQCIHHIRRTGSVFASPENWDFKTTLCFGFGRQFDFDFSNTRTLTILLGPKLLPVQLLWIWTMFQSDRRSRRSLLIESCYSSGSQRSHAPQSPIANSVENNAKMGDECRTHYKTPYKCPVCFTQVRSQ